MKFRNLTILAAAAAVGLGACATDDGAHSAMSTPVGPGSAAVSSPAGANFSAADVEFAQGMIPHHEQAVEMADIALSPAVEAGAKVRNLATQINAAQDPEIQTMTGWLTTWGQPMQMDTGAGHAMSSMDGMMSDSEMNTLHTLKGAEFDAMWIKMMIRHHEGAIAMAQKVKANGSNPGVLTLADQVITAQQGEIAEMKSLQGS